MTDNKALQKYEPQTVNVKNSTGTLSANVDQFPAESTLEALKMRQSMLVQKFFAPPETSALPSWAVSLDDHSAQKQPQVSSDLAMMEQNWATSQANELATNQARFQAKMTEFEQRTIDALPQISFPEEFQHKKDSIIAMGANVAKEFARIQQLIADAEKFLR